MSEFRARTEVRAAPADVLRVLADPDCCRDWSPIPFRIYRLESPTLVSGCSAAVGGDVLGREVAFDVLLEEASTSRFSLRATNGSVWIDVRYEIDPAGQGSILHAVVHTRGCGLGGRVVSTGIDTLIRAGALSQALRNIAAHAMELSDPAVAWAA